MSDEAGKCPCCNNPWSKATGDLFAKLCEACTTTEEQKRSLSSSVGNDAISRDHLDEGVVPSANFFNYANGGWMKNNPIPPEYPSWNCFLALHLKSQENLLAILSELQAKEESMLSADEAKVALFYAAAMNEDALEELGIGPMEPLLDLCDEVVSIYRNDKKDEYAKALGKIVVTFGVNPFFDVSVSPDAEDSNHTICQIYQGGIGLPDRDYYFDEDKESKRTAYQKHVAKMLTLLADPTSTVEEPTEEATQAATNIFDLERSLAEAHMTKTECRDPHATYNKMTLADLTQRCEGKFNFGAYFEGATGRTPEDLGLVNVRNTAALERVGLIASTVDPEVLSWYLRWNAVTSCAPYLSKAFVNENFDFFERTLSGTKEIKPRWKRAMAFTETALGEALGQLYCAKHFEERSKERALQIVENVRQALEDRLKEVEWMKSSSTRDNALKKMGNFGVKIGFPNKWRDYTTLDIRKDDSFLEMVFKARAFLFRLQVEEMNAPTDREKWFLTPQTVNAYYHPNLNEVVFPAAILQPPFFHRDADDAVNYGSMGAVIGHEMTHGFDDKGRKYDFKGTLTDWWTEDDAKEYDSRVQVMVNQANAFEVHGQFVKGALTSGENIADLGGLRLALRALKSTPGFDYSPDIDGFSPIQRFFLAWAQCWRQNTTKERALQLLTLDPHGPNEMRCNMPLSNIPEFHSCFDIPADSPMFKPNDNRVDIW